MSSSLDAAAMSPVRQADRYDGVTMALHWATALLVVVLFALAETWGYLPRGTPLRRNFQYLHVSLGIILAAVIVIRLAWRIAAGRRLAPMTGRAHAVAAKAVHGMLYLLLIAQAVLGFLLRWAQGEAFTLFGLFAVPNPFTPDRAWAHQMEDLHNKVAWVIMILAAGHAVVALVHHYGMKDGVLRRMLPGRG